MKPNILSASLLPLFAMVALACSGEDPEPPTPPDYLFGVEEQPFGKTYEQWAEAWFQWAFAIPKAENPILDGPCEGHQMGDVFFLAGNVGGQTTRACAVPAGKAIFFPIVNSISWACPEYVDNPDLTCEMLTSEPVAHDNASSFFNDYEVTMTLEIDGNAIKDLDDRRAHTATFDDPTPNQAEDVFGTICSGPIRENTCDVPVGSKRIAAADGYWVMLKPLPAGEHEVQFTGKIVLSPDQTFELDVTYNLTVAP
ncbi:hypothetical protein KEG38_41690 [Polyangium jinanense]|uniref:hypothetical protein n=1 Tax=Polyangium jinanense TaxID=2829994 RepID=UPI002342009A|nr:hypothetical protein [Polyangium jinanense]MDC3960440.1 hypothetical protein [Polyangium jinanense]